MDGTKKLRIAYFLEGMPSSGVETSTRLAAQALVKQGHAVTVFTPWVREEMEQGVAYFRLPSVRMPSDQAVYWTLPVSVGVLGEFRRHRYDVLHLHTPSTVGALVWQISKLHAIPIVYTYHTLAKEYAHYWRRVVGRDAGWLDAALERYDRMVCNRTAAVIAPSRKAANYLAELGVEPPVYIVPNGIDGRMFRPGRSNFLRDRFGIPAAAPILLFVGRINYEKRPTQTYELFRTVSERRNDVHLVMAGDGPLADELRAQSQRDGLDARLHFTGVIPYETMPEVYRSADVWVSTSRSEVHPMVALEAVACGLPAAAIADDALHGVVEPDVNGILASNTAALADGVLALLDDEARRLRMGAASAQIGRRYDAEASARRLAELYASVRAGVRLDLAA